MERTSGKQVEGKEIQEEVTEGKHHLIWRHETLPLPVVDHSLYESIKQIMCTLTHRGILARFVSRYLHIYSLLSLIFSLWHLLSLWLLFCRHTLSLLSSLPSTVSFMRSASDKVFNGQSVLPWFLLQERRKYQRKLSKEWCKWETSGKKVLPLASSSSLCLFGCQRIRNRWKNLSSRRRKFLPVVSMSSYCMILSRLFVLWE